MPSFTRRTSSLISTSPSPSPSPPPTLHFRRSLSHHKTPPPALSGLGLTLPTTFTPTQPSTTKPCSSRRKSSPEPDSSYEVRENTQWREREPKFDIPLTRGQELSDAECWERMLWLQREYHCYNSARLEAAVEALERGARVEEVGRPSRLCLDLLNEELKVKIEGWGMA